MAAQLPQMQPKHIQLKLESHYRRNKALQLRLVQQSDVIDMLTSNTKAKAEEKLPPHMYIYEQTLFYSPGLFNSCEDVFTQLYTTQSINRQRDPLSLWMLLTI